MDTSQKHFKTSFTLKIVQENAQILKSDFRTSKLETSVISAASNFQWLFVLQFYATTSWFEERSVHGTIIRATLSFLSSLLATAAFCKRFCRVVPSPPIPRFDNIPKQRKICGNIIRCNTAPSLQVTQILKQHHHLVPDWCL